jgi:hypothetical protein
MSLGLLLEAILHLHRHRQVVSRRGRGQEAFKLDMIFALLRRYLLVRLPAARQLALPFRACSTAPIWEALPTPTVRGCRSQLPRRQFVPLAHQRHYGRQMLSAFFWVYFRFRDLLAR